MLKHGYRSDQSFWEDTSPGTKGKSRLQWKYLFYFIVLSIVCIPVCLYILVWTLFNMNGGWALMGLIAALLGYAKVTSFLLGTGNFGVPLRFWNVLIGLAMGIGLTVYILILGGEHLSMLPEWVRLLSFILLPAAFIAILQMIFPRVPGHVKAEE